ncbi:MAG: DUF3786 domain-containing protein, partial [Planctomycetota bacterium]
MELDRQTTARRAKCLYDDSSGSFLVTLLNKKYTVNLSNSQICDSTSQPANFLQQLCILAYLINAQDLPLAGKLVKPENLPTGPFFFRGIRSLPLEKLKEAFETSPAKLYRSAEIFDAKRCQFGDSSIELNVLPRIPVTIVIWAGDDEFESRVSILFDRTAGDQMPLDALLAVTDL